ncbi:MAG: hypothetical protein PHU25_21895 [Deltaproteobacteria bacterium]|nr:hypothetical protein [Deltaproteobacteria bacterium]
MKILAGPLFILAACAVSGCDPELGQALDDVSAATPSICTTLCEKLVDCSWTEFTSKGVEKENALADQKDACAVTCAYRAENGAYIYEYDYNNGEPVFTFSRAVSGSDLMSYIECLDEKALLKCDSEHFQLEITADTQAKCTAWEECATASNVILGYDWNSDDQTCYATSADNLWQSWF